MNDTVNPKVACLITGMHRSGTSALSGLMTCFGADIGKNLMTSKPENPKGFWENQAVVDLNDVMLNCMGCRWDIPGLETWHTHAENILKQFIEPARDLIKSEFGDADFISIKDPRTSFLLPFWRAALQSLGYRVYLINIVRDPVEVFQSLNKRNGFTRRHADVMWLEALVSVLELSSNESSILQIQHDFFFDSPRSVAAEIDRFLALKTPNLTAVVSEFEASCFDPTLRHFHSQNQMDLRETQSAAAKVFSLIEASPGVEKLDSKAITQMLQRIRKLYPEKEALLEKLDVYLTAIVSVESSRDFFRNNASRQVGFNSKLLHALEFSSGGFEDSGTLGQRLSEERRLISHELDSVKSEFDAMNQKQSFDMQQYEQRDKRRIRHFVATATERDRLTRRLRDIERGYYDLESHFYSMEGLRKDLTQWQTEISGQVRVYGDGFKYVLDKLWLTTRWKFGDKLVSTINGLLGRKNGCEAQEVAAELAESFKEWSDGLPHMEDEQHPSQIDSSESDAYSSKEGYASLASERLNQFLSSDAILDFRYEGKPDVSVILILYNRAELTLPCLESLSQCVESLSVQLIIVDNASSDATERLLERIAGACILRNEDNIGFLLACNQALDEVDGQSTLFLNNDAVIIGDSVERAHSKILTQPNVGAVGARIISVGDELQEAGSSCWADGSCFGYGRGEKVNKFEFLFEREVDFCSGAFLMTSTKLLKEYGGFDEQFAPAYYEDLDYCLRLNYDGYKVLYDPQVVIRHYEFGSSEGSSYALDLSIQNQQKFVAKHSTRLLKHYNPDINLMQKARFAAAWPAKTILYIDDRVPHSYFGAGFPRSNFMANALAELGYRVAILPLNFPDEETPDSVYQDINRRIEVLNGIGRVGFEQFWNDRSNEFDAVWVSRPHNMEFVQPVIRDHSQDIKLVYDAEAIFADREDAMRKLGLSSGEGELSYEEILNQELALFDGADAVVAVSVRDRNIIRRYLDSKIPVLHCGYGVLNTVPQNNLKKRAGLLFVGNLDRDETPNVDSLLWFFDFVWPLIKAEIPDAKLDIVGSNEARVLEFIEDENIIFHGRVADLNPYYEAARVFIAPTRYAAGIPLKVQEASANGVPCVTTDLLARQLGWSHAVELMTSQVGDSHEFAMNCVKLIKDESLWSSIQQNSKSAIERECNPKTFRENLKILADQVLN